VTPARSGEVGAPASRQVRRGVSVFLLSTLLGSWVPWTVLLVTSADPFAGPVATTLWILGGYGPTVAALLTARIVDGRAGLRHLLAGLRRWRVGRWYLTLVLPLAVAPAAVLATVAAGPAVLELAGSGHWVLLPAMLAGGVLFGGFEEVGWRGYLLPRLQPSMGSVAASVVIGLVWALWHAPLFLLQTTAQASFDPVAFTLHAVALSLVLTWLYDGSGGSVLLAVLFHGAVNGAYEAVIGGIAPEAIDGFLAPAAAAFLLVTVVARLGRVVMRGR
jgi:uncharacterized protein